MNTVWTSVGSIIFGMIAIIVPIIGIVNKNKLAQKSVEWFTALSFSACGMSLCIQIYCAVIMVKLEDWSGLMDTINVMAFVSDALLVITIILNLVFIYYKIKIRHSRGL